MRQLPTQSFEKEVSEPPYPIRDTSLTDMSKYCRFHKGHNHNTDDCIHLKDAIEGLINRGWLAKYVKGGKRVREDPLEDCRY